MSEEEMTVWRGEHGSFGVRHNWLLDSFDFQTTVTGPLGIPTTIHSTIKSSDAGRLAFFIMNHLPKEAQLQIVDALNQGPSPEKKVQGLRPHSVVYDEVSDEALLNLFQTTPPPENDLHDFDPGGRGEWARPRCRVCLEFKNHPIHQEGASD